MNYEEFKLYITKIFNNISEENLIKLWTVYENFYDYYNEKANFILDLLLFIYNESEYYDVNKMTFLTKIMLHLKIEIYLGCDDKGYLERIMNKYCLHNELSDEDKIICLKYIEVNTKNKISEEIQFNYIYDYYNNFIEKELTSEQLNDILSLDFALRNMYINTEIDFDNVRNIIIDCYNINNNFNYSQSYGWCIGNITTLFIDDIIKLCYFFEEIIKDETICKEILDKYYILGCLNDLNYNLENNINSQKVMEGKKYLIVNEDILFSIAESIENYWYDDMQPEKSYEFIYGIIKEGINLKNPEIIKQEEFGDEQIPKKAIFSKFSYLIENSLKLNDNKIDYLWNIYKKIGDLDNLDFNIIQIMIVIYPYVKDYDEKDFIEIIFDLKKFDKIFIEYLPTYFDDDVIYILKNEFFDVIEQSNLDYDEKQGYYEYVKKKINEKRDNYYDEENIEEFFDDELVRIHMNDSKDYELEDCKKKCLRIYDILINFPYLKDIPKYVIKNAILLSHVVFPINTINFGERVNLSIGLSFYKKVQTLEDINNIIYNYYNDKTISDEYKDIYFNYGVLCYLEQVEINVNTNNQELLDGINYYSYNADKESTVDDVDKKVILDIATNISDYWHDFNVKKHNKDFQLGIIYKGIDNYKIKSIEREEVNNQKQLTLNNNFS